MPRHAGRAAVIDERRFHRWLATHLPAGAAGLLPLGDDAAALRPPPGRVAVLTTDAFVEGVHFRSASPPERVGAAVVAVSLSDLAAKGAAPAAILLALLLPRGTRESWAAAVVRGAERESARYGASVVGGDTKPAPRPIVVGFGLGWARAGRLAPRTGARPGDLVVTTGAIGRGGLAAARLARAGSRGAATPLAELLEVRPRLAEGRTLVRWAHAMLDTSDGLAEAAHLLAEASRLRVVLEEEALPYAPGFDRLGLRGARKRAVAFYGGDYELLFALAPRDLDRARRAVRGVGGRISPIGRLERGRGAVLLVGDRTRPLPRSGWQPFRSVRLPVRA